MFPYANFGIRYQGSPYNVALLGGAPWQVLIADPSSDLAQTPDDRLALSNPIVRAGTVDKVFTYFSIAEVQRGRDMFAELPVASTSLHNDVVNDPLDIFNIHFWNNSPGPDNVMPAYQAEIDRQRAQGSNGIFIDTAAEYYRLAEMIPGGGTIEQKRFLAAREMLETITILAENNGDLDFIVNLDAYFLSNASQAPGGASELIARFAAAVDAVLIEGYLDLNAQDLSRLTDFTSLGITVLVTHRLGGAFSDDQAVLDFYAHAASRGFVPFASPDDAFNSYYPGTPLFNVATEGDDVFGSLDTSDVLVGLGGNDRFFGRGGNDSIYGGSGNDTIDGGRGSDFMLAGGEGSDAIYGGEGIDFILGGDGNDLVSGGEHRDLIYGEAGLDVLFGDGGDDFLAGGADRDWVYSGSGFDVLFGGDGDDVLSGDVDRDWVYGEAGLDLLFGGDGDDVVAGGTGNDTVLGGAGADALFGEAGDDFIFGEGGNDFVVGGAGYNQISLGGGLDIVLSTNGDGGTQFVVDFSLADGDQVWLVGSSYANAAAALAAASNIGGATYIPNGNDAVYIASIAPSQLSAANMVLL